MLDDWTPLDWQEAWTRIADGVDGLTTDHPEYDKFLTYLDALNEAYTTRSPGIWVRLERKFQTGVRLHVVKRDTGCDAG